MDGTRTNGRAEQWTEQRIERWAAHGQGNGQGERYAMEWTMDQAMVRAMVQSMDVAMDGNGWMVRDRAQIKNINEAASRKERPLSLAMTLAQTSTSLSRHTGKQRNILEDNHKKGEREPYNYEG